VAVYSVINRSCAAVGESRFGVAAACVRFLYVPAAATARMSVRGVDVFHHLLLVILSTLVALVLYRFVTLLLTGLPWPAALP